MPDEIPPDEATPATADWAMMARIDLVLTTALQGFLDALVKKEKRGVDLTTMFMAIHNYHSEMLMRMANQIAPTNPLGRKAFYKNARDTFVRRMDLLMKEEEDRLLSEAISESERSRARKDGPN